jgi:nitroreductase
VSGEERFERWRGAASKRVSRRRFDPRPVRPEDLASLAGQCAAFRPFGSARAELVRQASEDLFRGVVGGYGAVKGAPSCLVFVGAEGAAAEVGYVGEAAVLEATALGLGTCWVAGLFRPQRARDLARVAPGERVFAVSPVGIPVGRKSMEERLMSAVARSRSRRPATDIAPGVHMWPEWAAWGIAAARLAPSAVNRQPWRFRREGDAVVVSVDGPDTHGIPKRLDCGIAMVHFEAGARSAQRAGRWEFRPPPDVAAYHPVD